ncbi:MAG: hypothetical protein HRT88_14200 [Lentisphaeraceae bacterium]|nr:hypothetical protein [Lentisphaeraceae bacterium]
MLNQEKDHACENEEERDAFEEMLEHLSTENVDGFEANFYLIPPSLHQVEEILHIRPN